jgi:hypothetical protein
MEGIVAKGIAEERIADWEMRIAEQNSRGLTQIK